MINNDFPIYDDDISHPIRLDFDKETRVLKEIEEN